jgi:hypothetical protein
MKRWTRCTCDIGSRRQRFWESHFARSRAYRAAARRSRNLSRGARSFRTFPCRNFRRVALAVELCLEDGIRSVEIGSLMFGEHATMDLLRLAIPRRVYTHSHIEYVVEVILEVWRRSAEIRGYEVVHQARMRPVGE